jgi:hypothetical protein
LQQLYHSEHGSYASGDDYIGWFGYNSSLGGITQYRNTGDCNVLNPIGFEISSCPKTKYNYVLGPATMALGGFFSIASSTAGEGQNLVMPGCEEVDFWTVDGHKNIRNTADPRFLERTSTAIKACY